MRLLTLITISFLLIGCGKSPEDFYQEGTSKYDQGLYEGALTDFKMIRDKFPEDSLAPKVLYKMARINFDFIRDYDAGKDIYSDLIMNYAGSLEGKQARTEMENLDEWLFNKSESLQAERRIREAITTLEYVLENFPESGVLPKVQYTMGDVYMNDLRDFPSALNSYSRVIEKYPGTIYAPRAKFMLGFIYANLLNDLEKAQIEYSEFLTNYPGHELEPSVQFELKFLGKDIDSINDLNNMNM